MHILIYLLINIAIEFLTKIFLDPDVREYYQK